MRHAFICFILLVLPGCAMLSIQSVEPETARQRLVIAEYTLQAASEAAINYAQDGIITEKQAPKVILALDAAELAVENYRVAVRTKNDITQNLIILNNTLFELTSILAEYGANNE